MAQLRKNITHTYHHCLPAFSQTNMLPFSSYYSANSVSMCTDSILPKQSQSSYSFLQRPLMILFQQWDGWIGRIPDYSSHVMVEYCLCTPRKGTACKSECKTPVRVNLRWFFSPGGSDYSISTWKSTHQYLRWGNCPVISIREENLSHTMWYWGEKAQAEEVGGKGYLILHYFFLILGLKGSSSQNYLKVHGISDPFPFPPRNVPCNSSGTPTVSQGEKVVEAHGKGGIVPSHRMCPTANCLNSAPSSPLLCLHIDVV